MERALQNDVGLANLALLKGSIHTFEQKFQDLNAELRVSMTEAQRDANRSFVPTVANSMTTVYDKCAEECGTGCYMRMKDHMSTFVQQQSVKMFPAATKTVEEALRKMCRDLEGEMGDKAAVIFDLVRANYVRVLGDAQVKQDVVPEPERTMKTAVKDQLKKVSRLFSLHCLWAHTDCHSDWLAISTHGKWRLCQ